MEAIPCNLCGSTVSHLRFPSTLKSEAKPSQTQPFHCTSAGYGLHPAIVQCARCGLIFASPRWDGAEVLGQYVAVEDELYLQEREGRVLTFQRHLLPLHRHTGAPAGRRLLDVGAYIGVFVEIAQHAGWQASGVEPSQWAVTEARKRGLAMVEGTLAAANFPAATFAVVTLWDVIEHLADPLAELQHAYRVLQPGGWLVIHTMDIDSWLARALGARWPWLMEMHLYYFSRRTLRHMLEHAGFQWVQSEPQGRYLRLSYLVTRVRPYSRLGAHLLETVISLKHWRERAVSLNLGDLVTAYARKPLV